MADEDVRDVLQDALDADERLGQTAVVKRLVLGLLAQSPDLGRALPRERDPPAQVVHEREDGLQWEDKRQ